MPDVVVSAQEFRTAATPVVRGLRIHQLALAAGLVLFAVATVSIATRQPHPTAPAPDAVAFIRTLSIVHALVFVVSVVLSGWLFRRSLQAPRPAVAAMPRTAAESSVAAIQGALVLQNALRAGPALLGLAICYLAVVRGVLPAHAIVALNALSAAVAVAAFVLTLPSQDRLAAIFERHLRRDWL